MAEGEFRREEPHQESRCPLGSLRLNVFSTPAHERASPVLIVHPRLSRAGG